MMYMVNKSLEEAVVRYNSLDIFITHSLVCMLSARRFPLIPRISLFKPFISYMYYIQPFVLLFAP